MNLRYNVVIQSECNLRTSWSSSGVCTDFISKYKHRENWIRLDNVSSFSVPPCRASKSSFFFFFLFHVTSMTEKNCGATRDPPIDIGWLGEGRKCYRYLNVNNKSIVNTCYLVRLCYSGLKLLYRIFLQLRGCCCYLPCFSEEKSWMSRDGSEQQTLEMECSEI